MNDRIVFYLLFSCFNNLFEILSTIHQFFCIFAALLRGESAAFRKRIFALFRNVKLDTSQKSNRNTGKMSNSCLCLTTFGLWAWAVFSSYPFDRDLGLKVRMSRKW